MWVSTFLILLFISVTLFVKRIKKIIEKKIITSPKKIKLVWSDEFNYNGLPDSSKWNYEVRGNGWVNHGKEFYTKADTNSAIVKNGVLSIIARKEKHGNNDYTSARLLTTVGGDFAGKEGIDDAAFPVVYQIDYVHVYE